MAAVRDIAIMVLVVEGLILMMALLIVGIIGSIAIIETTVRIRGGLRGAAKKVERLSTRVDDFASDVVVPRVIQIRRTNAKIATYVDRVRSPDSGASTTTIVD